MNNGMLMLVNSSTSACTRKCNTTWRSGREEDEGNIHRSRRRTQKRLSLLKHYFILMMSQISHFSTV
jgi:hypothetical protein